MDPEKAKAIQEIPKPEDVDDVQGLNGSVNYLAKFLPGLADVMKPLRRLTRVDVECHWTHEQDKAFEDVKKLVTTALILSYYDPKAELEVQCDVIRRVSELNYYTQESLSLMQVVPRQILRQDTLT